MINSTENIFYGRNTIIRPTCPFCGLLIERPAYPATHRPGEMPAGSCGGCGAVYSYDATGHNLGSAFIEALVFACNMDWDLAWSLSPEEDYTGQIVEKYDCEKNLIIPEGWYEGRKIAGALYFIRLQKDIQEVTGEYARKRLARAEPARSENRPPEKALSKKEVEDLTSEYQSGPILEAALYDKKVIRSLQRLLCSGDFLMRRRAADILGKASAVVARKDPGAVSNLLQGLLNSLSAPGAASWGSIDAIGEIIGSSPELFAGYIPVLFQFIGEESYRAGILLAIGKTAQTRPDLVRNVTFRAIPFLQHSHAETRAYAAWLIGNLGAREAKADLEKMLDDHRAVEFYSGGNIEKVAVSRLASEALGKIKEPEARSQKPE
ncbi:MAG: DVU0298 family protein [Bacillota bacterium]